MTLKCRIIGIAGNKGSGKDTCANLLRCHFENQGLKVKILHFADPLKYGLSTMLNIDSSHFFNRNLKEEVLSTFDKKYTPRYIMQFLGTNVFQKLFGENVWCKSLYNQIITQHYTELFDVILIPDVRFRLEVDFVKNVFFGKMIFVKEESLNDFKKFNNRINYFINGLSQHKSERWIYNMYSEDDYWIANTTDIENLNKICFELKDKLL